jgi:hypothetical protein
MENEITRAEIIGWIIANLGVDVRSRTRRVRFHHRALLVIGHIVDALGDETFKVYPRLAVDLMIGGGGWEHDNRELADRARAHIAKMEKAHRGRKS